MAGNRTSHPVQYVSVLMSWFNDPDVPWPVKIWNAADPARRDALWWTLSIIAPFLTEFRHEMEMSIEKKTPLGPECTYISTTTRLKRDGTIETVDKTHQELERTAIQYCDRVRVVGIDPSSMLK